jgi:hypothetical protein
MFAALTFFLAVRLFFFARSLFVVAVLVAHIPSGEDDHTWWQALLLAPLFGVFDIEIHVVSVFALPVTLSLKPLGRRGIVLDHGVEVEEFPIGIHAGKQMGFLHSNLLDCLLREPLSDR